MTPALHVLMGMSGAGKSTVATGFDFDAMVVSTDDLRGRLGQHPSDQSASGNAFSMAHAMTSSKLEEDVDVVFDSTALSRESRRELLSIAKAQDAIPVLHVVRATLSAARARNASPARIEQGVVVPDVVIEKQYASYLVALGEIGREDWTIIMFHDD